MSRTGAPWVTTAEQAAGLEGSEAAKAAPVGSTRLVMLLRT